MNFRPQCSFHSVLKLCAGLLLLCLVVPLHAEEIEQTPDGKGKNTLETLRNLVALQASLRLDMEALSKRIGSVKSESQKQELQQQLSKLQDELNATGRNLENVSAGVDLSALRDQQEQKFDLQEEIFALLKPAIDEMKDMTARIRQKSDLKEKIAYYSERLSVVETAVTNVERLRGQAENKALKVELGALVKNWEKHRAFIQSELQSAQLQLD